MTADEINALAKETHYERTHGFTLCFVLDAKGKWHMGTADHEDEEDARKSARSKAMNGVLSDMQGAREYLMHGPKTLAFTKTIPMTSDEYNRLMDGHIWPEQEPGKAGQMLVTSAGPVPRFMADAEFDEVKKTPYPVVPAGMAQLNNQGAQQ